MALAALIFFAGSPVLRARDAAAHLHLAELQAERDVLLSSLRQIEEDNAEAVRISATMDRQNAEKALAPVDRLQIVGALEKQAERARLSRFTYILSPEEPVRIRPSGAESHNLAQSEITLTADASLDTDVYAFIEHAQRLLPGRVALTHLLIERKGGADEPMASPGLHMSAVFEWLSNGSAQTGMDAP